MSDAEVEVLDICDENRAVVGCTAADGSWFESEVCRRIIQRKINQKRGGYTHHTMVAVAVSDKRYATGSRNWVWLH